MDPEKAEEFYERLKVELLNTHSWPTNYLYKFIVPTKGDGVEQIHEIFNNVGAVIESRKSRKGTYTSISVTIHLQDPDEVILKYKEVSRVKGVISL